MPTSLSVHTSDVCWLIHTAAPASVLDVGCGFGRWGFMVREELEVRARRYARESWRVRLEGIEPYGPYITDLHRWLYTEIYQVTLQAWLAAHPSSRCDMIIAGDVLEHLDAAEGRAAAVRLRGLADRLFVGAVPIGPGWGQGTVLGNVLETHRATWTESDVRALATGYRLYAHGRRSYAVWYAAGRKAPEVLRRAAPGWLPGGG